MTTPGAHPEPQPASPAREAARELSHEQLRHEVEALAEHRGVSIEEYLKTLVREERDAAIELAKASSGKK